MKFQLFFVLPTILCLAACSPNSNNSGEMSSSKESTVAPQNSEKNTATEALQYPYKEGEVPAKAWLEHDEIYNPEAVIPPQCYTKTEGENNPCYACHQSYPRVAARPNTMSDGRLQGNYEFSDVGMTNSWKNLFIDRRDLVKQISDEEIQAWVLQDNYTPFINTLRKDKAWKGEVAAVENLAYPEKAFDSQGIAKDGSHWVAFNYKPFPSTFWPTNGSTGDAMIRLPKSFREQKAEYSWDVYFTNLALVEMAVKELPAISTPAISEIKIGIDLNGNDQLEDEVTQILSQTHYVGDAEEVELHAMLYPEGTEFLHTVRYLGVDDEGKIFNAPRMKEVRYMRKNTFMSKQRLASAYMQEAKEKMFEQLPRTTYLGDSGISNGFGWTINGYIEDEQGELRPQHHQELAYCNGCHKTVGSTLDQTFSFPRKVEGQAGWGYSNLKAMKDVPNIGDEKGEFLTYFERVKGGDEFRQNQEMLDKWFLDDGRVNEEKVLSVQSLYDLIMPSAERALNLNKAYLTIVQEQSFIFGRDAVLTEARNVLQTIDDSQPPLEDDFRFKWDLRLDWQQPNDPDSEQASGMQ